MSHFTVIVIGDNVEAQLAPYHEFESTGRDDQYVVEVDRTDRYYKEYEDYGHDYESFVDYLERLEYHDPKYCRVVDQGNGTVKVIQRTNPNSKWDWWKIGGRWKGYFPTLSNTKVDVTTVGQLDIRAAINEAERNARECFAPWKEALKGNPKPESWTEVLKNESGITDFRKFYHDQPAIAAYNASNRAWGCPVEIYGFDEEAYVSRRCEAALVPHAVVKDGKWYEAGEMGWWAIVTNKKDETDWNREVRKLMEGLPPETRLTLVDCHI